MVGIEGDQCGELYVCATNAAERLLLRNVSLKNVSFHFIAFLKLSADLFSQSQNPDRIDSGAKIRSVWWWWRDQGWKGPKRTEIGDESLLATQEKVDQGRKMKIEHRS